MASLDEVSASTLSELALRADHAGHVLLTVDEVRFALSIDGQCWLKPVDALRNLYKLTNPAKDLGARVDHRQASGPGRGPVARR